MKKTFAYTLAAALMLANVTSHAVAADTKETAGQYVDDSVITAGVKAAIVKNSALKATEINVETYKGVVQLSGFVASPDNVSAAATVAGGVKGVKSVKNDLRVK